MSGNNQGFTITSDRMLQIAIVCMLGFMAFKDQINSTQSGVSSQLAVITQRLERIETDFRTFASTPRYTAADAAVLEGKIQTTILQLQGRVENNQEELQRRSRFMDDVEKRIGALEKMSMDKE